VLGTQIATHPTDYNFNSMNTMVDMELFQGQSLQATIWKMALKVLDSG